jgi:hypothetical protein
VEETIQTENRTKQNKRDEMVIDGLMPKEEHCISIGRREE